MSDSLLSSTDLTVESLVSQSNVTSYNESVQPQIRSRALSDLLSSPSDHAAELPVLEPIKIQVTFFSSANLYFNFRRKGVGVG